MRIKKARRIENQIEREVEKSVSKFSEHLMSNSKWVKLVNKMVETSDQFKKIQFKKVQCNQIGEIFINEDTTFGFDYWQNGFEGHNSLGGWLTYKEIEFLIFPKVVDAEEKIEQNLIKIIDTIESVGQFVIETDNDSIKLICYRK